MCLNGIIAKSGIYGHPNVHSRRTKTNIIVFNLFAWLHFLNWNIIPSCIILAFYIYVTCTRILSHVIVVISSRHFSIKSDNFIFWQVLKIVTMLLKTLFQLHVSQLNILSPALYSTYPYIF